MPQSIKGHKMIVVNYEQALSYHPILKYIPESIRRYLHSVNFYEAEEIRLRRQRPVTVYIKSKSYYINKKGYLSDSDKNCVLVSDREMEEAFELICNSSLYALEDSIKNGYITISGGSRVGICGSAITRDGKMAGIEKVSGLNYRISKEVRGAADKIIDKIVNDNRILNTLILSPPGAGKTTLLRDIVRNLSQRGYKVSVADERNEISATNNGKPGYELGNLCDVLEGANKAEMMSILIRTMSPDVIVTDELGGEKDIFVVKKAISSGVKIISSIHAYNYEDIKHKSGELLKIFDCFITLSNKNGPGTVEEIYCDI